MHGFTLGIACHRCLGGAEGQGKPLHADFPANRSKPFQINEHQREHQKEYWQFDKATQKLQKITNMQIW